MSVSETQFGLPIERRNNGPKTGSSTSVVAKRFSSTRDGVCTARETAPQAVCFWSGV